MFIKLKGKIIGIMVFVCLASILSISVINYFISVQGLKTEVDTKTQLEETRIAKEIDLRVAMQKDSLIEINEALLLTNQFKQDWLYQYLNKAGERNPGNMYYIAFSDGSSVFGNGWMPDSNYDPRTRDWYDQAMKIDGPYLSVPYVDAITGGMVITISKAFITQDNRTGVMASDIQLNDLLQFVSQANVGKDSYAFLLDQAGNILLHRNEAFMPKGNNSINLTSILNRELSDILMGQNESDERRLTVSGT